MTGRAEILGARQGREARVHVDAAVGAGLAPVAQEAVEIAFAASEVEQGFSGEAADDPAEGLVPPLLPLARPAHRLGRIAVVAQVTVEESQQFLFPVGIHRIAITPSEWVVNQDRRGDRPSCTVAARRCRI